MRMIPVRFRHACLTLGLMTGLISGLGAPALAQDEPQFRGLSCYALSRPTDSAPRAYEHGNVYFLVATWQSGTVEEQPSLLVGYDLRPTSPPQVRVGSDRFDMFADGQEGFLDDLDEESELISSMRRGSVMRVTGTTIDGAATSYEFSLSGVTAALQRVETLCN